MAKKLLVPVLPTERFYEAVVAAGCIVATEGGLITFLFTEVRPPEATVEDEDGRPSQQDFAAVDDEMDPHLLEEGRAGQVAGLEEARQMLYDRGITDGQINYAFADNADAESAAQAIADEAAAGAYDLVVLSKGYIIDEVEEEGSPPEEIADTVQKELRDEGVRVLVT